MIIEKHILITDPDLSLLHTLKDHCELSSVQLKQSIQKGCLWIQKGSKVKRLRRLKTSLQIGQELHFYFDAKVLEQQPLVPTLIEDNQAYSIWHKPAGMLCQGSKWADHTTIYRWVEKNIQPERPAIIVHRLDKMTSGLMILAHQKKMAAAFTRIFENRQITKSYRTKVHGLFNEADGELTIKKPLNDKSAISHVKLVEKNELLNQSLLDVQIETGRKHQIRQHLSGTGYPIVGDRLYGIESDKNETTEDLQLAAYKLSFECPVTKEQKYFQLEDKLLPTL